MLDLSILHILDHSLPILSGYSIRSRDILAAQAARGWTVHALTGARHRQDGFACASVNGIPHYRMTSAPPRRGRLGQEVVALVRHILAVAKVTRPDILHVHSPPVTGLAAAIAARLLGLPLVYEVRAFWEDAAVANGQTEFLSLRYRVTRALEGRVLAWADAIIALCPGLATDMRARGIPPEKITLVPNGVPRSAFASLPPDRHLAEALGLADADILAFAGSLYAYEGVADLMAAMPLLVAQHPRATLLILGDGPEAGALRAAARTSPVAAHIRMMGAVPPEAVDAYYALAQLMVYPRRSLRLTELVTPLKPIEAMAKAKPVVLSDIGGHRDLLCQKDIGIFVPPSDPVALATRLAQMLADAPLRQMAAQAGQAYVAAHHDWTRLVDHYEAVYHRLAT